MPRFWKITTPIAALAAGSILAACGGSQSSSPSSAPPSGSLRKDIKAVGKCLTSHGADATGLTGLLTGAPITATTPQLSALRSASTACQATVPANLERNLTTIVSCLDGRGYHLDASAPLASLFSLDLSAAKDPAAIKACSPALPKRSSKAAGT